MASYVRSKNVELIREAIEVVHERPWEWSCLWDDLMDAQRGQPPDLQFDLLACCACVAAWAWCTEPETRLGTRSHDDIYYLVDPGHGRGVSMTRWLVLRDIEAGSISPESILTGTRMPGTNAYEALDAALEYIDRHGLHRLPETRYALQRAIRGEWMEPGTHGEAEIASSRAQKRMKRLLGE